MAHQGRQPAGPARSEDAIPWKADLMKKLDELDKRYDQMCKKIGVLPLAQGETAEEEIVVKLQGRKGLIRDMAMEVIGSIEKDDPNKRATTHYRDRDRSRCQAYREYRAFEDEVLQFFFACFSSTLSGSGTKN